MTKPAPNNPAMTGTALTGGRGPRSLRPASVLIGGGRGSAAPGTPLNVPMFLASNFMAAEGSETLGREYSRDDGTPGWEALESVLGEVEGGRGVAFASGMAAAAAVLELMPVGSTIVAPTDCYTGVRALLADGVAIGRWTVNLVDITDTDVVIAAAAAADLLWVESPTNPLLDIADLPALFAAARAAHTRTAIDNTFATALLQQPLALGADIVIHSATKFIGGHSDLLLGVAITADPHLYENLRRRREVGGATPGSLETFLALRGLRTMALRLEQGQRNAMEIAARLQKLPGVVRVRYPGLPSHPGHRRAAAQMSGFGAVLALELSDAATADTVCTAVQVIKSATSIGGVESTIERRGKLPGQEHIPPGLLRLSVGCENVDDLWEDLSAAISAAASRPLPPAPAHP